MRVWLAVPRWIFFMHPQCAFFACWGLVLSLGSHTLLRDCSLFMDWVFYPFPFFSGLFCCFFSLSRFLSLAVPLWWCLWGCSSTVALLLLAGVAISRSWGVLGLMILGFEFLEFIVPFTSSGHWLAVLPCLLGFAYSPRAWAPFAPPSGSLWVSVAGFAFLLGFGVPLFWCCLCLWVRLCVPFCR